ncbi:TPA: hypothetical protein ACFRG8_002029, partial [Neisseria lactamica]
MRSGVFYCVCRIAGGVSDFVMTVLMESKPAVPVRVAREGKAGFVCLFKREDCAFLIDYAV